MTSATGAPAQADVATDTVADKHSITPIACTPRRSTSLHNVGPEARGIRRPRRSRAHDVDQRHAGAAGRIRGIFRVRTTFRMRTHRHYLTVVRQVERAERAQLVTAQTWCKMRRVASDTSAEGHSAAGRQLPDAVRPRRSAAATGHHGRSSAVASRRSLQPVPGQFRPPCDPLPRR